MATQNKSLKKKQQTLQELYDIAYDRTRAARREEIKCELEFYKAKAAVLQAKIDEGLANEKLNQQFKMCDAAIKSAIATRTSARCFCEDHNDIVKGVEQ